MRSPRALRCPLNGRRKNAQIDGPSLRKKNRITTASAAPVTSSPTMEAPARAPDPTWLLVAKSMSACLADSICSASTGIGPVVMKFCSWSRPSTADDEGNEPADHQQAREQGQPRRHDRREAALLEEPHNGRRGGRNDDRDQHGDHDELELHEREDHDHGQSEDDDDLPAADRQRAHLVCEEGAQGGSGRGLAGGNGHTHTLGKE
jgi:hypothetical protein